MITCVWDDGKRRAMVAERRCKLSPHLNVDPSVFAVNEVDRGVRQTASGSLQGLQDLCCLRPGSKVEDAVAAQGLRQHRQASSFQDIFWQSSRVSTVNVSHGRISRTRGVVSSTLNAWSPPQSGTVARQ